MDQKKEVKVEMSPEVASGHYSNLALMSHTPSEFYLDFIMMSPSMPQARVQTRVIMTPENAKNLLFALRDNVAQYEKVFGEIVQKHPRGGEGSNGKNGFTA